MSIALRPQDELATTIIAMQNRFDNPVEFCRILVRDKFHHVVTFFRIIGTGIIHRKS